MRIWPEMHHFFHFTTIRRQLLWSYGVLVLIIVVMVGAFAVIFLDYYIQVDELLSLNAATATITIKMQETHQLLENTINYEDPSYIRPYRQQRFDLEAYIRDYDQKALRTAELLEDYNAYYHFLEIQELIRTYALESNILLNLFGEKVKRFDLYDKLYSLRDINYRIYELQAALLVRQNDYLRLFYTEYAPIVQRRLVGLCSITLLSVVFAGIWTMRQARQISTPLHQLVVMNMALAEGNFSAVRPVSTRNGEVRRLGDAFMFMARRLSEFVETEKRVLLMENSLRKAELEALQARVNPHFLFNTLNTVRALAQTEGAADTERIIDALASFLRWSIDMGDFSVPLTDEFSIAEDYLKIQKMRFGNRLDYSVDIEDSAADIMVPRLLFQPIVENAVIHGIEPCKGGGMVQLRGYREAGETKIEICDNGVGMTPPQIAQIHRNLDDDDLPGGHVGIFNTWRRLSIIDPKAGMKFSIPPEGRGTKVTLYLSRSFLPEESR